MPFNQDLHTKFFCSSGNMSGVDVKDILELDRGPEKEFITKDALMNSDKKVCCHSGEKMQDRQFVVVCFIILNFVSCSCTAQDFING